MLEAIVLHARDICEENSENIYRKSEREFRGLIIQTVVDLTLDADTGRCEVATSLSALSTSIPPGHSIIASRPDIRPGEREKNMQIQNWDTMKEGLEVM